MSKELGVNTKIALFKGKEIRKKIHNNEWWFSVADIVEVLTESTDIRQYIKKMRARDKELDSYWGTICTPVGMTAKEMEYNKNNPVEFDGVSGRLRSLEKI